jgi:hypothetical protein
MVNLILFCPICNKNENTLSKLKIGRNSGDGKQKNRFVYFYQAEKQFIIARAENDLF